MQGNNPKFRKRAITLMVLSGGALASSAAWAQEEAPVGEPVELETVIVTGTVNEAVNLIPTEPVDSVFGFDKSLVETPRSVTTISNEMLNKFNISELDDMVALSPGSFTQSFFGVAGSLDVRGTPGEVYFRGIRRIDNPGNYAQPIGASDRVDIVRGPASPIYGPSKIGGYLNFVPKSARAENGAYMKDPKGELTAIRGSWEKDILKGEVGGPGSLGGKEFGYYLYAETEDSGSYYQNTSTDQSIYQGSFNMDLTESSRIEFGGMYHEYESNQVAGWNRLTQDLIDNGTYITGSPPSLDGDGDGLLSAAEAQAAGLFSFYAGGDLFFDPPTELYALENPGTAQINGSQVLVQEDDELSDEVITLYFDFVKDLAFGGTMTNKMFYESLDNTNLNAYGFSQFADTWVFEDQLIFAFDADHGSVIDGAYQISPSIRYQDFEHGDNFEYEYFDRRDITKPGTPVDRRTLSVRDGSVVEPFSSHTEGNYAVYGLAALADWTAFDKLHLLAGIRQDYIEIDSTCLPDSLDCTDPGVEYSDSYDATSWNASLSYDIIEGVTPYVTLSEQSTMIVGQGGEVPTDNVIGGTAVADSELTEYGFKTSLWDDRLYTTVAYYDQERVDFNAQNTVTNNTTQAKGWELEFRGVLTDNIAVTGAYTKVEVFNLTAKANGGQFSFLGAEDLTGILEPSEIYGGTIGATVPTTDGRKAGVPEDIYSAYLIFTGSEGIFTGLTGSIGATYVDAVYSGFSQAVKLPSYTLLNAGVNYETKSWRLGLQGKNLTDERYFRSNFPDLFGGSVVLPELPRNWLASVTYKF